MAKQVLNKCRSQKAIDDFYVFMNQFEDSRLISGVYYPSKVDEQEEGTNKNRIVLCVISGNNRIEMRFNGVSRCSIIPFNGSLYGSCINFYKDGVVFYGNEEMPTSIVDDFDAQFTYTSMIVSKEFSWKIL
jgi:hypothetical protein